MTYDDPKPQPAEEAYGADAGKDTLVRKRDEQKEGEERKNERGGEEE